MMRIFAILALLLTATPAAADMIDIRKPIPKIKISESERREMIRLSYQAVSHVYDQNWPARSAIMDEAFRAAVQSGISSIDRVLSVEIVGYRVIVLAVASRRLGPMTIGEDYVYFQIKFDDPIKISSIELI